VAIRTQFFDEFFTGAGSSGIRQVVILACGLDTRPWRLCWPTGTVVFEVDQPGVVDFKSATLAALDVASPGSRALRGHRFAWGLAGRALRPRFDIQRPTAWIAEGLLGYLPPMRKIGCSNAIDQMSTAGSWLAVDWHPDMSIADTARSREVYLAERERSGGVDVSGPAEMV
jgi:methyltransferase (TIGR00027 family)